ncbi:MAG: ArnT family glycosyltransferase [Elusimicrobiota bacterium]
MKLPRAPLWVDWAILVPLLGLYLWIGTRQIDRPALNWDEGDTAAYGMELALDLPRTETDWSVRLAGRSWPLRVSHPYDFKALPIYWSALAFKTAGVGVSVLRLSSLAVGAILLAVFYAVCRLWFGSGTAFMASLLLAVNPAFALMSRLGYYALEIPLALPALAALTFLSLWHRRRRVWALCAGAFCWGLSTCVTTQAVAFILAYPILYFALVPRKDRPSPRLIAAAAAFAALGAADFILYNAARGMPIISRLLDALAAPTGVGVDNAAIARNLALRGRQLLGLLDGRLAAGFVGGDGVRDAVLPIFFAAGFAAMVWRCASRRRFPGRGFILLVLGLILLLFLETAFTPMGLDPHHLLVLLPYVFLPVAAALDWLRTEVERHLPGKGALAAAALLALPVASALRADASYLNELRKSGGTGRMSGAIEDLAADLDRRGIRRPFCLSYGISRNTYLLTQGRVEPLGAHAFRRGVSAELLGRYENLAALPEARFIAAAGNDPPGSQEYLDAFRGVVERSGRRLVAEREYRDGLGRAVFVLWRVDRGSRP